MADSLADHVHDPLAPLGRVERRRLFGGAAFRLDGEMIAIVSRHGGLYLKSASGEGLGAQLKSRRTDKKTGAVRDIGLPYHRLPDGMLDDAPALQAAVRARLGALKG